MLDLSEAAGTSFKIALGPGGFFLAQVPARRWAMLSGTTGPGQILDRNGTKIGTGCISWGPSPQAAAPFLRQRQPHGIVGPSPNEIDEHLGYWADSPQPCKPQLAY